MMMAQESMVVTVVQRTDLRRQKKVWLTGVPDVRWNIKKEVKMASMLFD
jgi:hypothetical protein